MTSGAENARREGADQAVADSPASTRTSVLPKGFGKNVFMNYMAQGVTALAAVLVTPFLLHHLGKATYGLWVVASSAVAYLELFELGFGGATVKLVAEDASVRPERALRTLNTTFFVLVPLGVIALAAGVGLSFVLPHLVHISGNRDGVFLLVILLAFGLAVSIPGDSFGGALIGHQRYDLLAASNAGLTVVTAAASIGVVVAGYGIVMLAIVTTAASVLFHLVRLSMVRHILPGTRISPRLVDRQQRTNALRLSGWFLLAALLEAIYTTGGVIVTGAVLGLKFAAIYAVGYRLATAAINGLDSMAQVFFPSAAAATRNQGREALADITIDSTRVTLAAGLVVSVTLLILAAPGIHAWVGPGYSTSANVLMVLAVATTLASPVRAISTVLYGSGHVPLWCALRAVEVVVLLILSVTLGLAIGPVGVAVGTLGSVLLVRLPGYFVAGCRATGLTASSLARRAILPNVIPGVGCAAVLLCLRIVPLQSIPWVLVMGTAGLITFVALFFAAAATPDERRRGAAFLSKTLPVRWRSDPDMSASAPVDDVPQREGARDGSTRQPRLFATGNRVLRAPAHALHRVIASSPASSPLPLLLGPLRDRLDRVVKANDVVKIAAGLARAEVGFRLAGGWGVDALLGRQTRPHHHLHAVIDYFDRDIVGAVEAISRLGFRPLAETAPPPPGILRSSTLESGRFRVTLVEVDWYVLRSEFDGEGLGSNDAHDPALRVSGVIAGQEVPCLSADMQFSYHLAWERQSPNVGQSGLFLAVAEAEDVVGATRRSFDPTCMPAHVTVLYPFASPASITRGTVDRVRHVLAGVEPFTFTLPRLEWFDDRVLYLAPDKPEAFVELSHTVMAEFPDCQPYGGEFGGDVVPHLTIADGERPARMRRAGRRLLRKLPIEGSAVDVWLMTHNRSGRWALRLNLPLGMKARQHTTTTTQISK